MPHVFISYSRKQRKYVRRLADHLVEVAAVEVWFDYEIVTGERWDNIVRTKIDECAALIVVMTPDAEDSLWVAEEVARARDQGKILLPLLLEGTPIFGFRTTHHEDVRGERMPGDRFIADLNKAVARPRRASPYEGRTEIRRHHQGCAWLDIDRHERLPGPGAEQLMAEYSGGLR